MIMTSVVKEGQFQSCVLIASKSQPRLLSTAIFHLFIFLALSLSSISGLKIVISSILLPRLHTPAVTPAATAAPRAVI